MASGALTSLPWSSELGFPPSFHVAYLRVLQQGYRVGRLSTVYATARGSGPFLAVIFAISVLGERPHPLALLRVAIVIVGIVGI